MFYIILKTEKIDFNRYRITFKQPPPSRITKQLSHFCYTNAKECPQLQKGTSKHL